MVRIAEFVPKFDLVNEFRNKGPSISWAPFFELSPKIRTEMARLLTYDRPKGPRRMADVNAAEGVSLA